MQESLKKQPSLEDQIQTMLIKVMDEDETATNHEDNLNFSEETEEGDSGQFFEYKKNSNIFQHTSMKNLNHYSHFFDEHRGSLPSFQQEQCGHPWYYMQERNGGSNCCRINRKFQTVSFNPINDVPIFQMILRNNQNCCNSFVPTPLINYQVCNQNNGNAYNNIISQKSNNEKEKIKLKRNGYRNKTYSIIGEPKELRKNEHLLRTQPEIKKFGTMTFPKDTNIKNDLLLFELNNLLLKSEKIDHFIYNKLQGNFVDVIKTHKGSRIFQNYLKNTQSDILHQIFMELSPILSEIMIDPYANYFCKRFFSFLNQKDRIEFLNTIQSSITQLSVSSIGTYPLQGIIEEIGSKVEKNIIINAIRNSLDELCVDTYGAHVIEKIIGSFEEEFVSFIYHYIINNFLALANNNNGICIVKKLISFTHKKEIHEKVRKIIKENAFNLIQHPYGNYVIQIVIDTWDDNELAEILSLFENKCIYLSMQKYSSNLVERCIEKNKILLNKYIKEICESNRLSDLMKNHFGNYVVQKALKISEGVEKGTLVEYILKNINKLNNKKLISRWKLIVFPHLEGKGLLQFKDCMENAKNSNVTNNNYDSIIVSGNVNNDIY